MAIHQHRHQYAASERCLGRRKFFTTAQPTYRHGAPLQRRFAQLKKSRNVLPAVLLDVVVDGVVGPLVPLGYGTALTRNLPAMDAS